MKTVTTILAVAATVLTMTLGAVSANAGGRHEHYNNHRPNDYRPNNHRRDGQYTARVIIGSIGSGLFYDLQPYRQPNHYRQIERRRGHRGHHHYRHNRHQHNYRHDHHRRGHHHGHRGHHSRRH